MTFTVYTMCLFQGKAFHFGKSSKIQKSKDLALVISKEMESSLALPGAGKGGMMASGYGVSFPDGENVLE